MLYINASIQNFVKAISRTFMMNNLKGSIPFVVKTAEGKIEEPWLFQQIDQCIFSLHEFRFNKVTIISANHSTKVDAFNLLLKKYPSETRAHGNFKKHPSNTRNWIYLFFDFVHLFKKVSNNLCNSGRFTFS